MLKISLFGFAAVLWSAHLDAEPGNGDLSVESGVLEVGYSTKHFDGVLSLIEESEALRSELGGNE